MQLKLTYINQLMSYYDLLTDDMLGQHVDAIGETTN